MDRAKRLVYSTFRCGRYDHKCNFKNKFENMKELIMTLGDDAASKKV